MISAARMKKGTAIKGKLSMPTKVSLSTTSSGKDEPSKTAVTVDRPSAKATGTPMAR